MPVYADTESEELLFRELEPHQNERGYTLKCVIPNNTLRSAWLEIDASGAFLLMAISGMAQGPVSAAGIRVPDGQTTFAAAGTTIGYAERGLALRIVDVSNQGREVTDEDQNRNPSAILKNSFIPIENLVTPGYGFNPFFRPQPFRYWFERGTLWRFDIQNKDTTADLYHSLNICLLGRRYA